MVQDIDSLAVDDMFVVQRDDDGLRERSLENTVG